MQLTLTRCAFHRIGTLGCVLATFLGMASSVAWSQDSAVARRAGVSLPFAAGERLTYRVRSGKLGTIGRGIMSVEGPVDVRGIATLLLRSEMHARVGFVKAEDISESWLDPLRMSAMRFHKRERRAFRGSDAQVEMFPEERRWEGKAGKAGSSPTDAPLDELSFIYFVRTLPLDADTLVSVVRHYDAARNPVGVRVIGRDSLVTGAGTFRTIVVEMRVKDEGHFDREGIIRIHLSDDARRLPVRIESSVAVLGNTVLTLETYTPAALPADAGVAQGAVRHSPTIGSRSP